MTDSSVDAAAPVPSVAGVVGRFAVAGLIALASVSLASVLISREVGRDLALAEARRIARLTGTGIVGPAITEDVLAGDATALDELNERITGGVLEGSLVRARVWDPEGDEGRIVYADDGRLIGDSFPIGPRGRAVLDNPGAIAIADADLAAPENRLEDPDVELLEALLAIDGPDGQPLLYATYFLQTGVQRAGQRVWLALAPLGIGSLLILQIVQLPLAWSLARRLRRASAQREHLLAQSIAASARERRRIAADLHDGVVQDLTGLSYALTATASAPEDAVRTTAGEAGRALRSVVGQLRSLLVDVYPPDLGTEGLGPALEDLLARHRTAGLAVSFTTDLPRRPPTIVAELVYRTAHEALRNVAAHARATAVEVALVHDGGDLVLRVDDDGIGFDVDEVGLEEDHFGFRLLADVAASLGARLEIRSAPGAGTTVLLRVPQDRW